MTAANETKPLITLWRSYRGLLLFLVLMLGFRSAWADWVTVPSGSMNPTILEGDSASFLDAISSDALLECWCHSIPMHITFRGKIDS